MNSANRAGIKHPIKFLLDDDVWKVTTADSDSAPPPRKQVTTLS